MPVTDNREKITAAVSAINVTINLALTVFKFAAAIVSHSAAMVSDAFHSASDVFGTAVVFIGVRLACKSPDADHQYGHERLECAAAVILSFILAVTGAAIGFGGIQKITHSSAAVPEASALWAAAISIIIKEIMYRYTNFAAKKINSGALSADAWHNRSDALDSAAGLIGILGARMGFPASDSAAAVIISIFIIRVAVNIFRESMEKMTDKACDDDTVAQIRDTVLSQNGVLDINDLKTRKFGNGIYIDTEILIDKNLSFTDAHTVAENVQRETERKFPSAKRCSVRIKPNT